MMSETIGYGDFGVSIYSHDIRKVNKNGYDYIALKHNTEYSIGLRNISCFRCDALVSIDGKNIGKFRIKAHGFIKIHGLPSQRKKFIFLRERSREAHSNNIIDGNTNNGTIIVTFYPDTNRACDCGAEIYHKNKVPWTNTYSENQTFSLSSDYKTADATVAGATGLGGWIHQKFNQISEITDIDHSRKSTITVRLVADDDEWGMIDIGKNYFTHHNTIVSKCQCGRMPPIQGGRWSPFIVA